jgi:hypothetical protein
MSRIRSCGIAQQLWTATFGVRGLLALVGRLADVMFEVRGIEHGVVSIAASRAVCVI